MKHVFFWKGMEEASFKKTEDGYIFFPYGIFGGGHAITETKKGEIARFIRTFYTASTVLILPGVIFNYWISIGLCLPLIAWYMIVIRRELRGTTRVSGRRTYSEAERASAATMSSGRVFFLIVAGSLMTLGSGLLLIFGLNAGDREQLAIGAIGLVFFGFAFIKALRAATMR